MKRKFAVANARHIQYVQCVLSRSVRRVSISCVILLFKQYPRYVGKFTSAFLPNRDSIKSYRSNGTRSRYNQTEKVSLTISLLQCFIVSNNFPSAKAKSLYIR